MAGSCAGVSAVERRSWWSRPPEWPDGRLLNANEDLTTRVCLWVAFLLLAAHVWVLGRSGTFDVAVGDSLWIIIGGLVVASVLCVVGARRRIWARATSAGAAAPNAAGPTADGILREWMRAPRWGDGRRFAVRDPMVTAAALGAVFTACATLWLLGETGVPRIDMSTYQDPLLSVLQVAAPTAIWVAMIRVWVVQAVVEGWADDDSELGFIQGRIAAVAVDAKRARAQFTSASG